MRLLARLKFFLVLGLLVTGTLFLVKGLGINIPVLKFERLEAHNIPMGVALLVIGIALACLWKIRYAQTLIKTRVIESPSEGRKTTTTSKVTTNVHFMPEIPDQKREGREEE
jgi:hypothetical protein